MKRNLTVFLFFIFLSTLASGQITIIGKVLNKTTHIPIPYANIGIEYIDVGTISNMDGSFSILIPNPLSRDALIFSSPGYEQQELAVKDLEPGRGLTIYLDDKTIMQWPVILTASDNKHKDFEIGNFEHTVSIYEPDTVYTGRAIALLIDKKNFPKGAGFPVYVKKAALYIQSNNFESFKFRVRINKYDSLTGEPGEDLLEQSIIVESNIDNGWLDFDLSKAYFSANGPFFITFEQLLDLSSRTVIAMGYREIHRHPTGTHIGFSNSMSGINKYSCFNRQTSMGEWRKLPYAITATVTVNAPVGQTPEKPKEAVVLEMR